MNIKLKLLAASVLTLSSLSAMAADTAELKVIGRIVPAACDITFTGGDTIDFGSIPAGTLSPTDFTALGSKPTSMTINCTSGATRMAVSANDDRAGSNPTGIETFIGTQLSANPNSNSVAGLGLVGGKMVGSFVTHFDIGMATADGNPVDNISSSTGGAAWFPTVAGSAGNTGGFIGVNAGSLGRQSWAPTGTIVPAAYTTVVQPLTITAALNKVADLPPLTAEVPLDGQVTISIRYL